MEQFQLVNEGDRLVIYLPYLEEGLDHAKRNNISDIWIETQNVKYDVYNQIEWDLKLISNYHFIEFVSLSDSRNIFEKGIDINCLSTLKNLKGLRLDDSNYIIDFSLFPNLNFLEFYYSSACKNINELINLEYLHIYNFNSIKLQELSKINNLKTLLLWDAKKLISLEGISNLKNLWRIDLIRAIVLEDVKALIYHNELCKLRFMNCKKLSDISVIAKMKKLEILIVNNCKSIKDYFQITQNNSIVGLLLTEVDSLLFTKEMNKLERISFEKIVDNDLSPLLEVKMLRKAEFPSKRTYNYTEKEINAFLNHKNFIS